MKTDIEEDIKKINDYIHDWYDNLTDEDGHTIETLDEDSKEFIQAIENILADREEWKNKAEWFKRLCNENEETAKQLQAKANKYDSLVEKIKDKIIEEKEDMHFAKRDEIVKVHAHTREVLKELVDTEKERRC